MRDHKPAIVAALAKTLIAITADAHPAGPNADVLRACHTG
jgi:hypothetical protein